MNLHQLKALDALARHGSFSRAAQALGVSQPAVSIQLRKLQEEHGVKLFRRWGREVKFSELGRELVLKSRRILGLLEDVETTLAAAGDLRSGRLNIGLSCHYFVMKMLSGFMSRYPGVQVRARIGDSEALIDDVLACRLDLAEVTATSPDERFYSYAYADQRIVLFTAKRHPWASLPYVPVDRLDGQAMVARHASSMTRQIFERQLGSIHIQPKVVLELDAWESMKAAVAAGIGFGIALADEFTHDDRLAGIPVTGIDLTARQYFICLPEYTHLRTVQAFLDLVREVKASQGPPCGKGSNINPATQ